MPQNEPYKLTFFVENETKDTKQMHLDQPIEYKKYDDVVIGSYDENGSKYLQNSSHEPTYCFLSAFLYFITITTFAYLAVLWIKQKVHVQIEQMHWW